MGRKPSPELSVVGFPDFWAHAFQRFGPVIDETTKLTRLQNRLLKKPVSESLHEVLRLIARGSANSFGAVITLVLNGYGADAMRVTRSIFEADIRSAYLCKRPETVDEYLAEIALDQRKAIEYMHRHQPDLLTQVDSAVLSEWKRELKVTKKRRRTAPTRPGEMARDVGLGELHDTFYAWASSLGHWSMAGVAASVDRSSLDVEPAPSDQWTDVALNIAHGSFLRILSTYNEAAGHGLDREIDRRVRGFTRAWTGLS